MKTLKEQYNQLLIQSKKDEQAIKLLED